MKIESVKHVKIRPVYLISFVMALAYLLGFLTSSYLVPLIANIYTLKINNQIVQIKTSPIPSPSISPSPTSTTPAAVIKQSAKPQQPSEKALKVAGHIYALYDDENRRIKIREKAGVPKSDENTEIIQLGLWLDKNPGFLAKVEANIENYQLQQSQYNLRPLNCTSNTIGGYTYTNCY